MSPSSDHDESAVAAALISMKNETTEVCKRNLLVLKKAVPPRKKSRPSSKKPQAKRLKKNCMLRIPGDVEFTTDGKTIVTPDITCSKIINGKKQLNFGNVICNSCKRCFCCVYEIKGMKKCAMKRNCFKIHRELEGSQCKNAGFTPLSRITHKDYDKICNKKKLL
ncbi:predicted protein [Chaetoceros tenuissimus]|uniref:Uncharacterized protein n=1 Tax=Chaetoceros tenuissimus TaxID=426638 RepID=A0AAD3CWJ5_9STRA|nr:predicted protein [Chaetoceros tenuissimus]